MSSTITYLKVSNEHFFLNYFFTPFKTMILPIDPVCDFHKNYTFFRILEPTVALLIDLIGAEFRLDLLHFLCKNQTPIWAEASPQGG